MSEVRRCNRCNKDLSLENFWTIEDDYICEECYDLYHKPKYSQIQFDAVIDNFIKGENQKAIECLKELERDIREIVDSRYVGVGGSQATLYVDYLATLNLIDNKIKELEERNEN